MLPALYMATVECLPAEQPHVHRHVPGLLVWRGSLRALGSASHSSWSAAQTRNAAGLVRARSVVKLLVKYFLLRALD